MVISMLPGDWHVLPTPFEAQIFGCGMGAAAAVGTATAAAAVSAESPAMKVSAIRIVVSICAGPLLDQSDYTLEATH